MCEERKDILVGLLLCWVCVSVSAGAVELARPIPGSSVMVSQPFLIQWGMAYGLTGDVMVYYRHKGVPKWGMKKVAVEVGHTTGVIGTLGEAEIRLEHGGVMGPVYEFWVVGAKTEGLPDRQAPFVIARTQGGVECGQVASWTVKIKGWYPVPLDVGDPDTGWSYEHPESQREYGGAARWELWYTPPGGEEEVYRTGSVVLDEGAWQYSFGVSATLTEAGLYRLYVELTEVGHDHNGWWWFWNGYSGWWKDWDYMTDDRGMGYPEGVMSNVTGSWSVAELSTVCSGGCEEHGFRADGGREEGDLVWEVPDPNEWGAGVVLDPNVMAQPDDVFNNPAGAEGFGALNLPEGFGVANKQVHFRIPWPGGQVHDFTVSSMPQAGGDDIKAAFDQIRLWVRVFIKIVVTWVFVAAVYRTLRSY